MPRSGDALSSRRARAERRVPASPPGANISASVHRPTISPFVGTKAPPCAAPRAGCRASGATVRGNPGPRRARRKRPARPTGEAGQEGLIGTRHRWPRSRAGLAERPKPGRRRRYAGTGRASPWSPRGPCYRWPRSSTRTDPKALRPRPAGGAATMCMPGGDVQVHSLTDVVFARSLTSMSALRGAQSWTRCTRGPRRG